MVAPINYFQQLGFAQPTLAQQTQYFANLDRNAQERQMNDLNIQGMREGLADAKTARERQAIQFKDAQEQAEALAAQQKLYSALSAGDIEGADAIITTYSSKIEELGGAGAAERARQMLRTPEGAEKIKASALNAIQMAAGPDQFARFTAQQARPALEKQTKAQQVLELQREYQNVLKTQGLEAAKQFAVGAGLEKAPATSVSLNMPQDKKIAELDAKAFTSYNDQAKSARKQINTIGVLKTLSDKALSGTGADFLLKGGKLLNQLGVEVEGLTESEVFQQLSNTLVLDKSQQMSGALSNADMMFLQNTAPQLNNTKEGRRLSLEIAERLAKREIEIQNKAVEFRREAKKNGLEFDDAEFQSFMQQWAEQNPLMEGLKTPTAQAPKAAIDYLMANPDTKDAFIEKYGYLPEGVN